MANIGYARVSSTDQDYDAQIERLKQEVATGVFHNALQVQTWIADTLGVTYSPTGVKDLLSRIGASYHKVSGFFLEGGPPQAEAVRQEVPAARRAGEAAGVRLRGPGQVTRGGGP